MKEAGWKEIPAGFILFVSRMLISGTILINQGLREGGAGDKNLDL